MSKFRLPKIPDGSVVGLNYSGMHDTAITIVSNRGKIVFACSLERISRVKQDGRPPVELFEMIPWERIRSVAVSTEQELTDLGDHLSKVHPVALLHPRTTGLIHGPQFHRFLDTLSVPKEFFDHHLCHANSSFWLSGFSEALCLTYDGGMYNSPWFGAIYRASTAAGIEPLDLFSAARYAKITTLYSFVTALLGFTPNKHEGKITGLAAFGKAEPKCCQLLLKLLLEEYFEVEEIAEWFYRYSSDVPPIFSVNEVKRKEFLERFSHFRREDVAASVQFLAEEHMLTILKNIRELGLHSDNICLAGGLFANVRINQRVKQFGFKNLFVVPPMTDDGTALGAALAAASRLPEFSPNRVSSMCLGPSFSRPEILHAVHPYDLKFTEIEDPVDYLARRLAEGKVVGVFQGAMEFGPRALGNRSILSQATRPEINQELNEKLCRTEFMPFAPITRIEDCERCYVGLEGIEHTAEFMTITCNCTAIMRKQSPAVVHVDGTARPQLVTREHHPFLHRLLTRYYELTGIMSLINTSFNIHEEPIVCSPRDAIEGFLESGIDLLYFEGGLVIEAEANALPALSLLRSKRSKPTQKEQKHQAISLELIRRVLNATADLKAKEEEIAAAHRVAEERALTLTQKEEEIERLRREAELRLREMRKKDKEIEMVRKAADARLAEIEAMHKAQKKVDGLIQEMKHELQALHKELEVRLAEMQKKDEEMGMLRRAADARLTEIQTVTREAAMRLAEMQKMASALEEKEAIIAALTQTAEERLKGIEEREKEISRLIELAPREKRETE